MKKYIIRIFTSLIIFAMMGCATATDVRQAADLIRTDNELTRLLVEVRPVDQDAAATYLIGVASHAKKEADALKEIKDKRADAIAYYRIAATAFWRSGESNVANELFTTTNEGISLCKQMDNQQPDRDCLFLRLVIPFAGIESVAINNIPKLLADVDFNDEDMTEKEKKTMKQIFTLLSSSKSLVQKILKLEADKSLLSHPSMESYYSRNKKKAIDYFEGNASEFSVKVDEFYKNLGDHEPTLGITKEDASKLEKLK
ncbi:MAG: hypothetical protein K8S13_24440 [Desulfobacula sp.]|uniref:hypothetical protein n=1 Tax=Desulfobacula sp. TaxID=2593537 RepID=UPI0025C56658|nr:hypothetical protein [Desulfobacula sp.]MCD4722979.1 hypothetical protein [Desulfobacula sp.]